MVVLVASGALCTHAFAEGGLPGGLKTVQAVAAPPQAGTGDDATTGPGGAIYSPFAAGRRADPRADAPVLTPTPAPTADALDWTVVALAMLGASGIAAWMLRRRKE